MKIVITGGTRGIGFALAKQFLLIGNEVTISGTSEKNVEAALKKFKSDKIHGYKCRVEKYEDVEELLNFAQTKMGEIDVWINNAGINQANKNFSEMKENEYKNVVDIDLTGVMNGTSVACRNMIKQGHGYIYNMEGLGSDGRIIPGSIVYGTTKRAVRYFTVGAAKESDETGIKIGRISPGMVLTEFLLKGVEEDIPENQKVKKVFNILADRPTTVAAYLVKEILKNKKNNAYISWLTTKKIIFRFMFAYKRKNKFFNIK